MGMLTTKLTLISGDIDVITTINSYINISFILNMKEIYLELGLLPIELVGLGTLQTKKCMGLEYNCDSVHSFIITMSIAGHVFLPGSFSLNLNSYIFHEFHKIKNRKV